MIWVVIFFVLMYFLFISAIKIYVKNKMMEMELSFLKASLEYCQLKFHMLQMLEVVYDKASEIDVEYKKDYEKIKQTLEKKFDETMNEYIKELRESVGYNTPYNNFNELINHAEIICSMVKNKKNNGTRKGNQKIIK